MISVSAISPASIAAFTGSAGSAIGLRGRLRERDVDTRRFGLRGRLRECDVDTRRVERSADRLLLGWVTYRRGLGFARWGERDDLRGRREESLLR